MNDKLNLEDLRREYLPTAGSACPPTGKRNTLWENNRDLLGWHG
jgi:hypothetical protein